MSKQQNKTIVVVLSLKTAATTYLATTYLATTYLAPTYLATTYLAPTYLVPTYLAPTYLVPTYLVPTYLAVFAHQAWRYPWAPAPRASTVWAEPPRPGRRMERRAASVPRGATVVRGLQWCTCT